MNERHRFQLGVWSADLLRLILGCLLAVLMLIPALIILFTDKITMWRIRSRQRED